MGPPAVPVARCAAAVGAANLPALLRSGALTRTGSWPRRRGGGRIARPAERARQDLGASGSLEARRFRSGVSAICRRQEPAGAYAPEHTGTYSREHTAYAPEHTHEKIDRKNSVLGRMLASIHAPVKARDKNGAARRPKCPPGHAKSAHARARSLLRGVCARNAEGRPDPAS